MNDLQTLGVPRIGKPFSKEQVVLRIKTDPYAFIATLTMSYNMRGELESVNIIFGDRGQRGYRDECIEIMVFFCVLPHPYMEGSEKKALLERVAYDPACASEGNALEKKGGTKHMILTAIGFVRTMFGQVETMVYTDNSHFDCQGRMVPLYTFYLAQNGTTWYQSFLKSRLVDPARRRTFDARVADLSSPSFKATIRFDDIAVGCGIPSAHVGALRALYESATTLKAFFEAAKDHAAAKGIEVCEFLSPWTDEFMSSLFGTDSVFQKWEFDVNGIATPRMIVEAIDASSSSASRTSMAGGGEWDIATGRSTWDRTLIPIEDI